MRLMVHLMNDLLKKQCFPSKWKEARVVLLPKGDKPMGEEMKFRPICLISTMAKLYEPLVRDRLSSFLEESGSLSPNQFGFRQGKSTILAMEEVKTAVRRAEKWCALITVNVKNAFNSVSWAQIIKKMRDRRVPTYLLNIISSYLGDRKICSGQIRMEMSAGVPQGSVLGPALWNVAYDDILRLPTPEGVKIIGYADDIAIVVAVRDIPELNRRAMMVAWQVTDWLGEHALEMPSPSSPEHAIFHCPRWNAVRARKWGGMDGRLAPKNIIGSMVENWEKWNKIAKGIEVLMATKEREERDSQARMPNP